MRFSKGAAKCRAVSSADGNFDTSPALNQTRLEEAYMLTKTHKGIAAVLAAALTGIYIGFSNNAGGVSTADASEELVVSFAMAEG